MRLITLEIFAIIGIKTKYKILFLLKSNNAKVPIKMSYVRNKPN